MHSAHGSTTVTVAVSAASHNLPSARKPEKVASLIVVSAIWVTHWNVTGSDVNRSNGPALNTTSLSTRSVRVTSVNGLPRLMTS